MIISYLFYFIMSLSCHVLFSYSITSCPPNGSHMTNLYDRDPYEMEELEEK